MVDLCYRKEMKLFATSKMVDDLASLEVIDEASKAHSDLELIHLPHLSDCDGVSAVEKVPEGPHLYLCWRHSHLDQPIPEAGYLQ